MTTPRRCWLVVLLLAGCGHPAPVAAVSATPAVALDRDCARIDPSFSNLVVTGRWHDHEVAILVDTGANSGAIGSVAAAGLTPRKGEAVQFAGASGEIKQGAIYDVDGLAIGGIELAAFRAHSDPTADETGYAFSIGLEHLMPLIVDFDVDQGWFCLRHELPDGPHPGLAPMQLASEGVGGGKAISLDVTIAGTPVQSLILDTGAGISTINADLLASFPNRRLAARQESIDGSGVRKEEYFVEVASLCALGTCASHHMLMPGADLSPLVGYTQRGIVGVPFFRGHRVILDFPHQRIGFEPSSGTCPAR